jgi:hypothetical protein
MRSAQRELLCRIYDSAVSVSAPRIPCHWEYIYMGYLSCYIVRRLEPIFGCCLPPKHVMSNLER